MKLLSIWICFILVPMISFSSLLNENWETGVIDSTKWINWGYPSPNISTAIHKQGQYSVDPNGDSAYLSGLVSSQTFTPTAGLQLSVDAYIQSASQWSELEFGFANTPVLILHHSILNTHMRPYTLMLIYKDLDIIAGLILVIQTEPLQLVLIHLLMLICQTVLLMVGIIINLHLLIIKAFRFPWTMY